MSQPLFRKSALAAALVSLGLAVGASAQGTSQQPSGGTAATPAPPAAGTTGMDKGAGSTADRPATTTSSAKPSASSSLASGERKFLEKAAQGSMAEIELGKLAMEKASSQQTKDLAKKIVDDHTKALDEVKRIATSKGVTLPSDVDGKHKRLHDKLAKKSGNDFDREYTDEMEDDHGKDIRDFRSMAKNAKDADVKAFAASTLPTLEQHHQMAKSAEDAAKHAKRDAGTTARTTPSGGTMSSGTTSGGNAATSGMAGPSSAPAAARTSPPAAGAASDTKNTSPPK